MKASEALAALKAHLAKKGFGDIEVNMTGGYDPNSDRGRRAADPGGARDLPRAPGLDPMLWPRIAGSWPGYVFTGEPLKLAAGHFGLGHGERRARARRVLRDRVVQPEGAGLRGRDAELSWRYLAALAAIAQ